ncbi:acid phosphatase [Mycoplasma struthionis]|uniref:Acid phosphatase n=2 Tax=Mycoplasma struthionis TaxID=538220 RepID=A0A3G8LIA6_9MOLU|nr:acid phosphatase [Mycoplasma struthionis]
MSAALAPIAPLAISCAKNDTKKQEGAKSESSALNKDDFTLAKESFAKLTDDQKLQVLNEANLNQALSQDQLHELIAKFNKDAGSFGGIVWYIKSAESLIAKEAAYKNGIEAYKKLMENEKNKNLFDFSEARNYNTTKHVTNAATDKFVPVVFMDIDETVLQNDLTEAGAMINGGFSNANKEKEDLMSRRFAVPGAVEFINYVQSHGGLVIYNSDMNQSEAMRDAVKENLKRIGVEFIANYQFWMRGTLPYQTNIDSEITKEKTENMTKEQLSALAKKLEFTDSFRDKPWEPWKNTLSAEIIGKKALKTLRMNGLDAKTDGWNLSVEDSGSGNAVKLKTIMRVGDNFDDFFDGYSRGKDNDLRVKFYKDNAWMKDIFSVNGAKAHTWNLKTNKFDENDFQQAYIMVPGNAEYGGWNREYGYGNVQKFYEAIKKIVSNPRYQSGPSATDNIVRR